MNAKDDQQEPSLSNSVLARIDAVCDSFEAAWHSGKRPKVEDYLGDTAEPERAALERELRRSEAELRRGQAPNPSLEEFIKNLADSGLMTAQEIHASREKQPKDAETLARQLVQAKKLTKFQAQAVYQGKIKGLVFGDYRVLDKLGQGGMGVVLKAEHRRMKRIVAVKMIAGAALKSPDAVRRFFREVEAAAKLMHPNIVAAFDAAEYDGTHYLIMEYVDGKDLSAIVKERGPLPIAQAVDYMIQAGRGLQYAHEQGIIHRDIKPANLLLDKRGTVKILDMGLARVAGLVDEEDKDRLTASGQVMGTLDYMAPEQALDTHHADARADVYSLGCTLYRLVTGEAIFKGDTLAKILIAHQMSPVPSLCQVRGDVPQPLDTVFQKMVAKKAEDRQQTMVEVIADLEKCVGRQTATSTSVAEEATLDAPMEDPLAFLKTASPRSVATATKKKVEQAAEATLTQQAAETSRQLSSDERLLKTPRKKKTLIVAVALGLIGIVALGIIIRIRRPDGTEQVIHAPDGTEVTVTNDKASAKPLPSLIGPDGKWKLPPNAPPPAIAPFDAAKAKQHQEAWAKYLGVPVEMTNSVGMKLVLIPPGEFDMGSSEEEIAWAVAEDKGDDFKARSEGPRHRVKITHPSYLGTYHVTQGDYEKVMGVNPSTFTAKQMDASDFKPPLDQDQKQFREGYRRDCLGKDTSRHPVETVSWDDCVEFCRKLLAMPREQSQRHTYRLPTEAEWEYACRAGTTTRWYFGDDETALKEYSWFIQNGGGRITHPVGQKKPNAWGLYDMYGNAQQWCADPFGRDYYKQSPTNDPIQPLPSLNGRVVRGGGIFSPPSDCRSARRRFDNPALRGYSVGFRVVCEIVPKQQPAATVDPAFIKEVAALPAEEQVARVVAKLKELNPGYDGQEEHKVENGQVVEFIVQNSTVKDISPVRALAKLRWLRCGGVVGGASSQQIHSPLADLAPLQGLPLTHLNCERCELTDLSPLRGMPIVHLMCSLTRISDLSPLEGKALRYLTVCNTSISDLSALRGMPLKTLYCYYTKVKDFTPLKDTPLKELWCDFDPKRDTEVLRSIKTLETINGLPVAEFWKEVEAGKIPPPWSPTTDKAATAVDPAFIKEVAALPAEQQVARVVAKLKELNPGYDGKEEHKIENGQVTWLLLQNDTVRDVSPIRALGKLSWLNMGGMGRTTHSPLADLTPLQGLALNVFFCENSDVSDLSPLQDMPLSHVYCGFTRVSDLTPLQGIPLRNLVIANNAVSDLSPLRGAPLGRLFCHGTTITDLSPLKDMPLTELRCDFDPKRDTDILRSMKTLEQVNGLPVAEFWKQVEAGKIPPPNTGLGGPSVSAVLGKSFDITAFIKEVAALPPEQQVARVVAKLKELNPGYDGKEEHKIENGQVVDLTIWNSTLKDVSPVRALAKLKYLKCGGLYVEATNRSERSPLADLTPLQGFALEVLGIGHSEVTDLSPLRGMPLQILYCYGTKVTDLMPLQGMSLQWLDVRYTDVSDISPLRGIPLNKLLCFSTKVTDFSPIKDAPLKHLWCDFDPKRDTEILRSIKTLEQINGLPVAEFWKQVEAGKIPPPNTGLGGPSVSAVLGKPFDITAFIKEVAALPAEQQVARVVAKLKELNPGYDGKEEHGIENGQVTRLLLQNDTVKDISPVRALAKLKVLKAGGGFGGASTHSPLADLTPLQGLELSSLWCENCEVNDLSPLRDMALKGLYCSFTQVSDLTPLKGTLLSSLVVNNSSVVDLQPLQGMPLEALNVSYTKVSILAPLQGAPLQSLHMSGTRVSDLSPLRGTRLFTLFCFGLEGNARASRDLSPLKDTPLKELRCDFDPNRDTEILRSIKTLEQVNGLPVAEFWKQVEAGKIPPPNTGLGGPSVSAVLGKPFDTDSFIKEVAALPAEQQVARVVAKLKELNPGYDGKETHKIENGVVVELSIQNTTIKHIWPVRALDKLTLLFCGALRGGSSPLGDLAPLQGLPLAYLSCTNSEVADLSFLRGMPLTGMIWSGSNKLSDLAPLQGMRLNTLTINSTQISDLSPLRGMPLVQLACHGSKVTDLSFLKEMPLKDLRCDFDPKRDTEILRSIKTLEKINGLPVAEFWKEVEAGKIPPPNTGL